VEGRREFPLDNGGVEVEGSLGFRFEDGDRSRFDRKGGGFRREGTVGFFEGKKTLK
jgi:hypothetical protein